MKNKLILLIFVSMFLISLVSAEVPTYKQNEEIYITRVCTNETAVCDGCNITSIKYPNSSAFLSNLEMTKGLSDFNYTLTNIYTKEIGKYKVEGVCWTASEFGGFEKIIDITPNGQDFSTGKAISYIGFILIILFTFLLTLYGAIKMEWKHKRNNENQIISINNFRYIKVFLFSMNYILMMFIFGLSYKFFNEANIQGFTNFFFYGYQLFEKLLIPIMITMVIIFFIIFITNIKIKDKLKLGIH